HTYAKGLLEFPGGRMDVGETPREGLLRELHEELGLTPESVSVGTPLHVDLWGVGGDVQQNPVVGIFYVVRLLGEVALALSEEHDEFFWWDPRHPFPPDTAQGTQDVLNAYRQHEGIVVASDEMIKGRQGYGLIQIFTGNGKGKTTAAIGEIIRAVGAGKKTAVIFFDKGGTHYMERAVFDVLAVEDHERGLGRVEWFAFGRDRIDPVSGRFDFSVTDEDKKLGVQGIQKAKELLASDQYDLLVLDEINSTTDLGMISEGAVLTVLDAKPDRTELVLTGRNAPQAFLDRAHLVTEMRLRKHYFYSGVKAREGIDY
ncbi:MAG: cob(I)yrinic acid a,c-diamide adenosyltransferase, partial [Patescibacteria group bacterium]